MKTMQMKAEVDVSRGRPGGRAKKEGSGSIRKSSSVTGKMQSV